MVKSGDLLSLTNNKTGEDQTFLVLKVEDKDIWVKTDQGLILKMADDGKDGYECIDVIGGN